MKLLGWYFKSNLLMRILLGLTLGAVCGIFFGPAMAWVSPFGEIFIRPLKMIAMPAIIFTLTVGAANVHPSQMGRVGAKALGIYMVTTAFTVSSGLLFGNLFQPGKGMQLEAAVTECIKRDAAAPSLVDTLTNVAGDLAVTCVVARSENEMDLSVWEKDPGSVNAKAPAVQE